MAWIESHQGLAKHPKTLKLSRLLKVHIAQAVGHLHFFWWWALDYAQDGDLSKCDVEDIAVAANWPGDAEEFVSAMCDAGFLDRDESGKLSIHDWYEYAGKLMQSRERQSTRKSEMRRAYQDGTIEAVRKRDGDMCRYCGITVDWSDRKTEKGGTYDHVDPEGPTTVDNLVVACRSCNSRKGRRSPEAAGMNLIPIKFINRKSSESSNDHQTTLPKPKPINDDDDIYTRTSDDKFSEAYRTFEQHFGLLNPTQTQTLEEYIDAGMEPEVIEAAAQETRKRGFAADYFFGILENCIKRNIFTLQAFREDQIRFEQAKANKARASPEQKQPQPSGPVVPGVEETRRRIEELSKPVEGGGEIPPHVKERLRQIVRKHRHA